MARREKGMDPQQEMADLLAKGGAKKPLPVSRPSPLIIEQGLDTAQEITHPPGQVDKSIEVNLVSGVEAEREQMPKTSKPETESKVALESLKKQFYELYLEALPYIETKQLKPETRKQINALERELMQQGVASPEINRMLDMAELEHSKHLLFNLYLQVPRGVTAYKDYPASLKQEVNIILGQLRQAGVTDQELGEIRTEAEQIRLAEDRKLAEGEKKEKNRKAEILSEKDIDSIIGSDPVLSKAVSDFLAAEEVSIQNAQALKRGEIEQKILNESVGKSEALLEEISQLIVGNKGYGKGSPEFVTRQIVGKLRERIRRKLGLLPETNSPKEQNTN